MGTLEGVERAAQLLAAHRDAGRVLVIGDFDADGATGSALLVRALRALRVRARRFPRAESLSLRLRADAGNRGAGRATAPVADRHRGQRGIEHRGRGGGPRAGHSRADHRSSSAGSARCRDAEAIVNPNLAGAAFGKPRAGRRRRGVLRRGGARRARSASATFRPSELLDLVALGTVADLVPLDRNNRVLVAQGLRRIRAGRCVPGIRALLELAGRRLDQLTARDLGFVVAPRLNAAGRLTDMSIGIACLLADDAEPGARARRAAHPAQRGAARNRAAHAARGRRARRGGALRARPAARRSGCACSMRAGIRESSGWSPAASRTGCIGR